jgi:outer membrane protein OmpA-like peptidoglycan-associated protein
MLSAVVSCGEKKIDSTATIIDALMRELPVVLYFHNDEPNPKTLATTTTSTYIDAYQSYLALKDDYIQENTRGLEGEAREDKEEITKDFFELKVDKGAQDLNRFSDTLLAALNAGGSYKLYVRGFASPRARTDYNLNLTKRRTASLENYLMADSSGAFVPYLRDQVREHQIR